MDGGKVFPIWAIVLLVLGSVLGIVIVTVVSILCWRRYKKHNDSTKHHNKTDGYINVVIDKGQRNIKYSQRGALDLQIYSGDRVLRYTRDPTENATLHGRPVPSGADEIIPVGEMAEPIPSLDWPPPPPPPLEEI